jgi:hypothetical protein
MTASVGLGFALKGEVFSTGISYQTGVPAGQGTGDAPAIDADQLVNALVPEPLVPNDLDAYFAQAFGAR